MKTIIELYDKDPFHNVFSALALKPERVLFAGDLKSKAEFAEKRVAAFLRKKGLRIKTGFLTVDLSDYPSLLNTLSELVKTFPDCALEIAGGDSRLLFAAGAISEKLGIPAFFFDQNHNRFQNIFRCESLRELSFPGHITVEDTLMLAGGSLMRHGHFDDRSISPEDFADIDAVWGIFLQFHSAWSKNVQYLQKLKINRENFCDAPLSFRTPEGTVRCNPEIMRHLAAPGILRELQITKNRIRFRYKNELLRRCLSDVGIWLELHTFRTALRSGYFDDARISVVVDWNGEEDEQINTTNEIDVILTKGIRPLFISCKMSRPAPSALNEIHTLARLFGGASAKAVVVTLCALSSCAPHIYKRALDLGITVVEYDDIVGGRLLDILKTIAGSEGS